MKLLQCIMALASLGMIATQLTENELQVFTDTGVTIEDHTDDPTNFYKFSHNGIPSHDYGDFNDADNPNSVSEQNHEFKVPKNPELIDTPECLNMGTIAVAINGIPIFNPYTGPGYNAVEGEYAEVFDDCDGHPQNSGVYHYHQLPSCLVDGADDQLMGVALDGFPIYGSKSNGMTLRADDLDECNGQMRNGKYEYRMTEDFPYVMGCYKGDSTASDGTISLRRKKRQMRPPPGGDNQGGMAGRCLYVKYCENPALDNCPDAATEWGGNTDVDDNNNDDNNNDEGDDENTNDEGGDGNANDNGSSNGAIASIMLLAGSCLTIFLSK